MKKRRRRSRYSVQYSKGGMHQYSVFPVVVCLCVSQFEMESMQYIAEGGEKKERKQGREREWGL